MSPTSVLLALAVRFCSTRFSDTIDLIFTLGTRQSQLDRGGLGVAALLCSARLSQRHHIGFRFERAMRAALLKAGTLTLLIRLDNHTAHRSPGLPS